MSGLSTTMLREHQGIYYLDFLSLMNDNLKPKAYFEIGTNTGLSIERFTCDAICVDPAFLVERNAWKQRRRSFLFQTTSDDFFASENLRLYFPNGPDIAFLDGLHLFEFLLRDFTNIERHCHGSSVVVLHDCLPLNLRMAERDYRGGTPEEGEYQWAWTGDVWKVLYVLHRFRPDLRVRYVDCPPTGLVVVDNLDPASTVLSRDYERIVQQTNAIPFTPARLVELQTLFPTIDSSRVAAAPDQLPGLFRPGR